MNAEVTSILNDKRILFVEDDLSTLEFFIDELNEATDNAVTYETAETLQDALGKLNERNFDLVVIDLHMPGNLPPELIDYQERIARNARTEQLALNQAQSFGMWLHQNEQGIPYVYLSSVPDAYVDEEATEDRPALAKPLNKFKVDPWTFPDILARAISQQQADEPAYADAD
jgi:CheY-like chemotaxis protein